MEEGGGSCFPSPEVGQASHSTVLNASGRIRNAMREGANLFVEAIGGGQSHAIMHSSMKPLNNHFSVKVSRLGESENFSSQFWEISDSNNLSSPCLHWISDIEKPRIGIARFVESSIKGTESRHQPYLSGNNITAFAQSAPPADSAALGQKFFFAKGQIWLAEFGQETGAFS